MKRLFVLTVIVLASLLGAAAHAAAQERFALVVGNSNYKTVDALPNPANDAEAMEKLLMAAGFEVIVASDLGQKDMQRAVRDFAEMVSDKGEDTVALVYYAGHGVQIDGQNYLLPVDADVARESDVPLEGVRLADLLNTLDTVPSKTRIVILDACRNNPFENIGEGVPRGLAIVNAPAGSIIAYSTSPGAVAEDGSGRNSPFTKALVKEARSPGAPIANVFQNVRLTVHKETDGRQTPWEVTALTQPFNFFPGNGEQAEAAPEKSEQEWTKELRSLKPEKAYETVIVQNNVTVYQIFVTLYAETPFAPRIRGLLDRRLEMHAWFDAVTRNTPAAFAAFLKRYPKSDLATTARRLAKRATNRSLQLANAPGALDLPSGDAKPEIRTVVKEVKVPGPVRVKEVIKEVKVLVPGPVRTVVKEVKVPGPVRVKTIIKKVPGPVRIKTVIKKVPGPVRTVVKRVPVPGPVRTIVKRVRVPCHCGGRGGGGRRPSLSPNLRLR